MSLLFDLADELKVYESVREDLVEYLLSHEFDIAVDENDFGCLRNVFKAYIGREPNES